MGTNQNTVLKTVVAIIAAVTLLFVAIPCCITGFMLLKFREAEQEKLEKQIHDQQRRPRPNDSGR